MTAIAVYSKPNCVQCDRTKKYLDKKGIGYTLIDVTEDAGALAYVKNLGYTGAPVVVTETDDWYGFRPDLLSELVK